MGMRYIHGKSQLQQTFGGRKCLKGAKMPFDDERNIEQDFI